MADEPQRIAELAGRVAGADGLSAALGALPALREEIERLEREHVRRAIEGGWTWRAVADALGVAKQSVHRKHRDAVATGPPTPPRGTPRRRVLITSDARRAMNLAGSEAKALGHRCVRPDHVLIGVMRLPSSRVADALRSGGVSVPALREAARRNTEPLTPTKAGITLETRGALERALEFVAVRQDGWLGEEHLVLALLEMPDVAAAVAAAGGDTARIRKALR